MFLQFRKRNYFNISYQKMLTFDVSMVKWDYFRILRTPIVFKAKLPRLMTVDFFVLHYMQGLLGTAAVHTVQPIKTSQKGGKYLTT